MSVMNLISRLFAVLLVVSVSPTQALSSVKFGDELLQRGHFLSASLEYQRYLVDQPDIPDASASEIADKALQSMWLSRDYKASAELAEFYSGKYRQRTGLNCISEYYLGLSYYGLKAYPRAQSELTQSIKLCSEPYYSRSLYWSGLNSFRTRNYEQARKSFAAIPGDSQKHANALTALNAVGAGERLPRKSPRGAGFLNLILPGAGYSYAGYPQTGAVSFLTIGLFTWGTVVAVKHDQTALAIILGSINLAWYFGGIQGAANAATRTNEERLNAVIKPLEIN